MGTKFGGSDTPKTVRISAEKMAELNKQGIKYAYVETHFGIKVMTEIRKDGSVVDPNAVRIISYATDEAFNHWLDRCRDIFLSLGIMEKVGGDQ